MLGGIPILIGTINIDNSGREIRSLLAANEISDSWLVVDPARPTTIKTRYIKESMDGIEQNHHLLRVDNESNNVIEGKAIGTVIANERRGFRECDSILVSDYCKGLIADPTIAKEIAMSGKERLLVLDSKNKNIMDYINTVDIFVPNKKEADKIYFKDYETLYETQDMAMHIGTLFSSDKETKILITLGENGISHWNGKDFYGHCSSVSGKLEDTTGAGDVIAGTMALLSASNLPFGEAVRFANYVAGLSVEEKGTCTPNMDEIIAEEKWRW